jgi:NADPH:quinone reductase-like Zn-dependent oxidoreductase
MVHSTTTNATNITTINMIAMPGRDEKILVVGACGQIGVELTLQLRKIYGEGVVIASDLREEHALLKGTGPLRVA